MQKPTLDRKRTDLPATMATFEPADGCFPEYAAPGSVELRHDAQTLMMACPGCGRVSGMSVGNPKPPNGNGATWLMTGGFPLITLSPSINCVGCCGWHGYLTGGVFRSC